MNKKIEEVFDLPPMESEINSSYPTDEEEKTTGLDLEKMQQQLDVADKIDAAFRNIRALPTNEFGNAKMGPVRSRSAIRNLLNFEKRLTNEGAKLVCGLNDDKATGRGYMFNPVSYLSDNPEIFLHLNILFR